MSRYIRGSAVALSDQKSTFLVTVQIEIPFTASPDDAIIWMNSILKHLEDNGATWPAHVVSARPKGKSP